RRTPPWRDRQQAADFAAKPRWRIQPATVKQAQNSSYGWSKVRSHCKQAQNSSYGWSKVRSHCTSGRTLNPSGGDS
ncbi:hypothetical protein ABTJ37_22625, partial [Acinetobacter baumannii]